MSYANLKIKNGPLAGELIPIDTRDVTIGRSQSAGLHPAGYGEMSREHARFTWDGSRLSIEDLGSRNGTVVNGKETKTAALSNGSVIELGDLTVEVVLPKSAPPAAKVAEPASSKGGYTTQFKRLFDQQSVLHRRVRFASAGGAVCLAIGMFFALRTPADPAMMPDSTQQKVKDATVFIVHPSSVDGKQAATSGSGFLIDRRTVITNRHVTCNLVQDAAGAVSAVPIKCQVVFYSGSGHEKKMIVDPSHIVAFAPKELTKDGVFHSDLAMMTLPEDAPSEPLSIGDTRSLVVTGKVFTVGFPLGSKTIMSGAHFTVSGDVVEYDRWPQVTVAPETVEKLEKQADDISMLQVAGSDTHGNSGGPIVNRNGEVVGVVQGGPDDPGTIIGFHIPTGYLQAFIDKAKGSHS